MSMAKQNPRRLSEARLRKMIEEATVVEGIDLTSDDSIVAICSRRRHRQRIPVPDLQLPDPLPKGAEWIEAYRRWTK